MTSVAIAWGNSKLSVEVPAGRLMGVLRGKTPSAVDVAAATRTVLSSPTGSQPLSSLARGKRRVVISVSDHTRPAPDGVFLPLLIEELRKGGVRDEDVTILVATGLHRPMTGAEISARFGGGLAGRLRIVQHDASDRAALAGLGATSDGCPVFVNRLATESDLLIATGVVEPHLYAGYSGGAKNIAIGTAGEETVAWLHSPRLIDDPSTRLGEVRDNPLRRNAAEIASRAGLRFIVNAVLTGDGSVSAVVAGEPEAAFAKAVAAGDANFRVTLQAPAAVVLVGVASPKDASIYQASRAADYVVASPKPAVLKGGTIIVAAHCPEGAGAGVGDRRFFEFMREHPEPAGLMSAAALGGVSPGAQRAYMHTKTRIWARVVYAGLSQKGALEAGEMGLECAPTVEGALIAALEGAGAADRVLVIPHGLHVVTV